MKCSTFSKLKYCCLSTIETELPRKHAFRLHLVSCGRRRNMATRRGIIKTEEGMVAQDIYHSCSLSLQAQVPLNKEAVLLGKEPRSLFKTLQNESSLILELGWRPWYLYLVGRRVSSASFVFLYYSKTGSYKTSPGQPANLKRLIDKWKVPSFRN